MKTFLAMGAPSRKLVETSPQMKSALADGNAYGSRQEPATTGFSRYSLFRVNSRSAGPKAESIDMLPIDNLWLATMATKPELLPGTLDMLILKTLARGSLHGYGIALSIKRLSEDVLTVEEGSLYPALQRLLLQGWVKAEWKMTETKRRARFYTLTAAGRKQLGIELSQYEQMIAAIARVLRDPREA